ncbi:MAG: glycosyltransferase [Candidatus Delongbacteria bacterium]|nr:glycosyltransferase [Candidatus Delongbacteria bacterium]MBN2834319.1 glycosyltransferase [Candidatus Delongbacteria bacterium]
MSYLLVTPVKNEISNLEKLFSSILEQTIKPILWLILDDGSSDGSTEVILKMAKEHSFISYIILPPKNKRDLFWRYHKIMKFGFEKIVEIAKDKNLNWDYIGVLDGDISLEKSYFHTLLCKMDKDANLGVVSGEVKSLINDVYIIEERQMDRPCGAARLIKKEIYDKIGYPEEPGADGVISQKARELGFKTIVIKNIFLYQSRGTNSVASPKNNAIYQAEMKYYLGYSIWYAILKFFIMFFKKPHYPSFIFIYRFTYNKVIKKERTKDLQILNNRSNIIINRISNYFNKK